MGLCSAEIKQIVSEYAGKVRLPASAWASGHTRSLSLCCPAPSPVMESSWNSSATFVRLTGTRLSHAQPSVLAQLNSFASKVPIFFSINIKGKVCLEIAVTSNMSPPASPGSHLSCPVRLLITQA